MGNAQGGQALGKGREYMEKTVSRAGDAARQLGACITKDTGGQADDMASVPGVTVGLHGPDVILEGCRVYGEGTAIASTSIGQDRVYFEVKIERNGQWAFGVARKASHAKPIKGEEGGGVDSWVVTHKELDALVGDVLSCTYDQAVAPTCLKFYHNGNLVESATKEGIKGEVFPAIYVAGGAELEYEFDGERGFAYPAPMGFSGVMADRRIM